MCSLVNQSNKHIFTFSLLEGFLAGLLTFFQLHVLCMYRKNTKYSTTLFIQPPNLFREHNF